MLTVISLVINLLAIKERKLLLVNFWLFGTEKCIECHQTFLSAKGWGNARLGMYCIGGTCTYLLYIVVYRLEHAFTWQAFKELVAGMFLLQFSVK